MPAFTYTARSKSGEKLNGSIDAPDRKTALAQIEKLGAVPVSVVESRGAAAAAATAGTGAAARRWFRWESKRPPRMGMRDVLTFSTELSDLLAAGLTLGGSLNLLAGNRSGRASDRIIPMLRDDIVQGASLSNALAKHPRSFSSLYVNMIRAGEASGTLTQVLRRLVEHYELMTEVRDKVITALVYPSIVLIMGLITVIISVTVVIPKFAPIFEEMGKNAMPASTRLLIGLSKATVSYGWLIIAIVVALGALANRALKTERGRKWWHNAMLHIPLVKGVLTAGIYANFARTLGTLMSNGVPVLRALAIVEQTVSNVIIAAEIRKARDRVTDGTTISGPLAAGGVFPKMMTDMLSIGERTGNVPDALKHVATRYEHQLDRSIKIITTALEPILILAMALLVGFVAFSILSAVFSMTKGLDVPN